ncbi:hypothetical protein Q4493_06580 [Colwellia sp. 1_MG-2023]|uniref:hypothetical protein n=1 Tax=Colwellia sp. 1_MG-2023 TaxID=3062649 RepID=UPI0026E1B6AB|nr:hypothetical protein [Colwellia sp. 1_MG-2023]MDO6445443.1 hypothetical protein [Colwellia sp. 1_MG-2023]
MDILGFFDGLFSAFSAARSGKNIDDEQSKKSSLIEQGNNQKNTLAAQSHKAKIKKAREKQSKSKQFEKDMG